MAFCQLLNAAAAGPGALPGPRSPGHPLPRAGNSGITKGVTPRSHRNPGPGPGPVPECQPAAPGRDGPPP
eukprot:315412-Hanusia_phi.AAC.1